MARSPIQVLVIPFRGLPNSRPEYALFRRSDEPYWQVIAGGAEDDETPLIAAHREAYEEARIPSSTPFCTLATVASIPRRFFKRTEHWPRNQYIVPGYYFAVDATDIAIELSYEHTEWRWFSYEEAVSTPKWDNDKSAIWELDQRILANDLGF